MPYRAAAALLALFLAARQPAAALAARSPSPPQAPRADASVRRALERGDDTLDVIVGLREEPAAPATAARETEAAPKHDAQRRAERLKRERSILDALPPGAANAPRLYASFPAFAARATRAGVFALADRADVAWVTLDGVRHELDAGPQPAQTLIGSDAANALGFDGTGHAIAVLDTGVDYTVPELGGGGFPNAKVVAGADLGDGDADPMDCAGHGTAVASVAAGARGVAPGARIVALKISASGRCDTAQDSVILSGIDWAVTHHDDFDISVINLSFGSAPFDGRDHGFCDSSYPQYVSAIEAASAAGIVFVASSGNEGLTGAIATPACISSALSVGAVYADPFALVAWGSSSDPFCEDRSVSPDTIVCFSNSASDLSLLAPGAFWVAAGRGGAAEYFSGTSAASPAAAGVAAVLQQARPGLPPSAVGELMRATGRPITDSRNGVRTARVDALAAVRLPPEDFASYAGSPVEIPAGGSAAVTAEVSGFSGTVASIQADVSILHDDPSQLTLTLTGPDGTAVRLHDRTGTAGHAIRGVYGATLGAAQSLGAFQGKPPNGSWTLTAANAGSASPARILGFAVRVVPGQPRQAIAAGEASQVLPLVGRVQGSRVFLSDARFYNPSDEPRELSLFYVAQGLGGAQAVRASHTVAPGEMLVLDDVVGSEFGYSDSIGALTLAGAGAPGLLASSRAYTPAGGGAIGQLVPALAADRALGPGARASANGLSKNARFHVNAGFAEVSGAPVTVRMEIFSAAGALLGAATRGAGPDGTVLVTDLITERGLGTTDNFRLDFTVTSPAGRIAPFAVLVDDGTGDGVFVPAEAPAAVWVDRIVPQASHATGGGGDVFRTDLHVSNVGPLPQAVTLSLIPRLTTGGEPGPRTYTVPAGATLALPDVLAKEFGLGDPAAAGIRIHAAPDARLVVGSRTYVERDAGSLGFPIAGQAVDEAIGSGDGAAASIQLGQGRDRRTNFGFAEVSGQDATVRVEAHGPDGALLGARTYAVHGGESVQAPASDLLGKDVAARDLYLRFEVSGGGGRILAYGVAVDNASGDAIYVPASRESGAASVH